MYKKYVKLKFEDFAKRGLEWYLSQVGRVLNDSARVRERNYYKGFSLFLRIFNASSCLIKNIVVEKIKYIVHFINHT